ncbi:hypothetical protein O1611_g10142 [Lasiodiplodia mahajangana]|uniref:Uncharacterized protein n=1 Tax=Lasiodiplodia mahajangana TaxID=1108764 RepID=A0ACC2J1J7_9PEZI|nr:hypothetical protein O1611_g10142 [Lasiodiplodia mahajangana]
MNRDGELLQAWEKPKKRKDEDGHTARGVAHLQLDGRQARSWPSSSWNQICQHEQRGFAANTIAAAPAALPAPVPAPAPAPAAIPRPEPEPEPDPRPYNRPTAALPNPVPGLPPSPIGSSRANPAAPA